MNKNQKGFAPILTLVVIAIVAVASYLFFAGTTANAPYQQQNQQANQNVPAIQNSGDLNTAANDLDNTDTGQIDTELNQLNSDASTF